MSAEQAVTWLIGEAAEREGWKIENGVVKKPCDDRFCDIDRCRVEHCKHRSHKCHGTGLVPAGTADGKEKS